MLDVAGEYGQGVFERGGGDEGVAHQAAGLVKQSVLKPVLTTIEQHLVIRTMGKLSSADDKALREVIGDVIG